MEYPLARHPQVVVKSQILAGGRGLGGFTNGFKGGVHIVKADDAKSTAESMLGQTLVTKQTGPAGKPVNALYLAAKLDLANEMYFAILLDRETAGPMLIGCSEGRSSLKAALSPSCKSMAVSFNVAQVPALKPESKH